MSRSLNYNAIKIIFPLKINFLKLLLFQVDMHRVHISEGNLKEWKVPKAFDNEKRYVSFNKVYWFSFMMCLLDIDIFVFDAQVSILQIFY